MTKASPLLAVVFTLSFSYGSFACQLPSQTEKQEMQADLAAPDTIIFIGRVSAFSYEEVEEGRYCVSIGYDPIEFLYGDPVAQATLNFCQRGTQVSDVISRSQKPLAVNFGNVGIIGLTKRIPKTADVSAAGKYRLLLAECHPYLLRIDQMTSKERQRQIAEMRLQIAKIVRN